MRNKKEKNLHLYLFHPCHCTSRVRRPGRGWGDGSHVNTNDKAWVCCTSLLQLLIFIRRHFLILSNRKIAGKKKKSPLKFQDLPFGYAFSRGAVIKLWVDGWTEMRTTGLYLLLLWKIMIYWLYSFDKVEEEIWRGLLSLLRITVYECWLKLAYLL